MAIITNKKRIPSEFKYIPVTEREDKKPFGVKFKRMSLEDTATIMDNAVLIDQFGRYTLQVNGQHMSILKATIKSWENMLDENNKNIKLTVTNGEIDDESLLMIPEYMRNEIASVILAVSKDPKNWEEIINSAPEEVDSDEKADEDK